MHAHRRLLTGGAAAIALATAAVALPATGAQAFPKLTECQHPVSTGEEAYHLKNVTAKTACPVVLALGRFERKPANIRKLYECIGPGKHAPRLKLHSFDGWHIAILKAGDFQMSRGRASFDVGGTDFPINCT